MSNSRRNFLRTAAAASLAAASTPVQSFAVLSKDKEPDEQVIGHNGFTYKVDKKWAKISVNDTPLSNCHEMVQDSQGRLIMIGDHTHNNIMIFDKSGKLLDYWGNAYPGGHGLSIGNEGGEDFLLITDCGWATDKSGTGYGQSGQVLKTTLDGKLIFAIGHPRTIGVYKDDESFKPTETAVAPNGDIYVADGYGSDYIIHYNSKGQYIRHFGGRHNSNPEHNLMNAHGVAVDTRNKNAPVLICTSRQENCFKLFTMDGKFIKRIDMPGMFVCRAVVDEQNVYAGVCWSKDTAGKQRDFSGFLTILDTDNKVISNPGGNAPVYKNGVLQPVMQAESRVFYHGHDVCVDNDKNLYVCQWNAYHTAPVKLTRV